MENALYKFHKLLLIMIIKFLSVISPEQRWASRGRRANKQNISQAIMNKTVTRICYLFALKIGGTLCLWFFICLQFGLHSCRPC